jgi:hypothetical protein
VTNLSHDARAVVNGGKKLFEPTQADRLRVTELLTERMGAGILGVASNAHAASSLVSRHGFTPWLKVIGTAGLVAIGGAWCSRDASFCSACHTTRASHEPGAGTGTGTGRVRNQHSTGSGRANTALTSITRRFIGRGSGDSDVGRKGTPQRQARFSAQGTRRTSTQVSFRRACAGACCCSHPSVVRTRPDFAGRS